MKDKVKRKVFQQQRDAGKIPGNPTLDSREGHSIDSDPPQKNPDIGIKKLVTKV